MQKGKGYTLLNSGWKLDSCSEWKLRTIWKASLLKFSSWHLNDGFTNATTQLIRQRAATTFPPRASGRYFDCITVRGETRRGPLFLKAGAARPVDGATGRRRRCSTANISTCGKNVRRTCYWDLPNHVQSSRTSTWASYRSLCQNFCQSSTIKKFSTAPLIRFIDGIR